MPTLELLIEKLITKNIDYKFGLHEKEILFKVGNRSYIVEWDCGKLTFLESSENHNSYGDVNDIDSDILYE